MNAKGFLLLLLLGAILATLASCGRWNIVGRQKQIDTFSDVYAIGKRIENKIAESGDELSDGEIADIVMSVRDGLDAWGNDIRVFRATNDQSARYIVVSPGRDGVLDFPDTSQYSVMAKVDIRGLFDRDIVFRDGNCVTNSGKDPHTDFPAPHR
ncbi:MAG: hypothetical protein DRJ61_04585 [Acidobacteria bacterium]|nr:MAG: hypothetical protein DRJ61_04585 [Acidobacteriota bacterium]